MTSSDSDEEADEDPEPKKGKSSPVKGAKGVFVNSDTTLFWRRKRKCGAAAIHQPSSSHGSGTVIIISVPRGDTHPLLEKEEKMWRCGDPPAQGELDRLRRELAAAQSAALLHSASAKGDDSYLKRGIIGTLGEQALQRLLERL